MSRKPEDFKKPDDTRQPLRASLADRLRRIHIGGLSEGESPTMTLEFDLTDTDAKAPEEQKP